MTQLEEKKMLAEFMGYTIMKEDMFKYLDESKNLYVYTNIHSSFSDYNSLMPVVNKIRQTEHPILGENFSVILEGYSVTIFISLNSGNFYITEDDEPTELLCIYRACIEFVKWWNEQQDKTK